MHLGTVGDDGLWVISEMKMAGVDIQHVLIDETSKTGKASIQVAQDGNNAIVIWPGANQNLTIDRVIKLLMEDLSPEDTIILLQNEIGHTETILQIANRASE
jgi:ribokinase